MVRASPPLPLAPVAVGRRRTRAAAQLEMEERRAQFKRRAAQQQQQQQQRAATVAADENAAPATNAVVIGASFGEKLPLREVVVERTPTKAELQSPPQLRRRKPAPQAIIPTPEKVAPAVAGVERVESADAAAVQETPDAEPSSDAPAVRQKRVASRGIAQSSSSFSTRKRMISFSPERVEREENRELALLKLQKNLKATEKLQQRLDGVDVLARNDEPRAAFTTPSKDQTARPHYRAQQSPFTNPNPLTTPPPPMKRAAHSTPVQFDTPSAPTTQTLALPSDEDLDVADTSAQLAHQHPFTPVKAAPSPARAAFATEEPTRQPAENGISVAHTDKGAQEPHILPPSQEAIDGGSDAPQFVDGAPLSQRDDDDDTECCPTQNLYSQFSEAESAAPLSCSQEQSQPQQVVDFSLSASSPSMEFTSTSVIEDVGLFNCDVDVEYTGGVYGEGTDGKVSAAVIGGQKVALKRAKPHDGFPEEEAKRRSAVELHYLRKVRNMQGFVQCLGLCDGIEHTCIALEVMDCKLSDYLRRYGTNTGSSSGSSTGGSSKRRYTLTLAEARGLLRQIALPMMLLHEQVNVAHGDLACRNILLRTPPKGYEKKWEPVVKLSDFGRIRLPSSEPKILDERFSFFKNCDVGSFGREILYRFLVGEIVPSACLETRSLHKQLQDLVVKDIPEEAKQRLGPYYRLFMRCTGWGVRPSFREIYEHLDDLEYFETTENGLFPLKPSGAIGQPSGESAFLSPVLDGSRPKFVSSGSKGKFETPNGASVPRTANGAPRLLQSKSTEAAMVSAVATTAATASIGNKTVNLLKARSVLRNTPHQVQSAGGGSGAPSEKTNNPRSNLAPTSNGFTPNGRPMLLKKTPPSAGASRRSLQILSQIQHRTTTDKSTK